jgi:predicted GTPase
MSQELLTPEQVLQEFHDLRTQVLEVIDEGEQVAKRFPAVAEAAKVDFEDAKRIVSLSHLSLVVLGAEGTGKSTLIQGLIGEEVSPIEHDQPGTVAPIYLEYADTSEPTFTIEFGAGKKPLVCDKAIYTEYILQKSNERNKKGVQRATVKLKNRLLEHGLARKILSAITTRPLQSLPMIGKRP